MTDAGGRATAGDDRWTPAQRLAMERRGGDLLVTAAAGSGKTSVLTRRVVACALDPERPVPLDRMLVVTFTRAAAAEMRERIARELAAAVAERPGDPRPRRQLALLGQASISTLDAFCLRLVRAHFHVLRIDPAVRTMDEHEAELLREDVLGELLEERHASGETSFLDLVDAYGRTGDKRVAETVLDIFKLAMAQEDPDGWLEGLVARYEAVAAAVREGAADGPSGATAAEAFADWTEPVAEWVGETLRRAAARCAAAARLAGEPRGPRAYAEVLRADAERLLEAAAHLDPRRWPSVGEALAAAGEWPRLPSQRASDCDPDLLARAKNLRERAKRDVEACGGMGLERGWADVLADTARLVPHVRELASLVRDFRARYEAAKLEASLVDFADLEQMTLRLLRDPHASAAIRGSFDAVLVDECQDINAAQDAILRGVAGAGRLFMVGDVKQSIYRFRLAEPALFLAKESSLPRLRPGAPDPGGAGQVALRENFRSRSSVVAAVNALFRGIFSEETGGIAYDAEAELVARAGHRELELNDPLLVGPDVEIHVVERGDEPSGGGAAEGADGDGDAPGEIMEAASPGEEEEEAGDSARPSLVELGGLEREALLLARRIREMVEGAPGMPPVRVWDPDLGAARPATYGDVAVLLRSARTQAAILREALAARGIPVHAESGGYFEAIEVEWALALLNLVDNPLQDIPLATALRSPAVGLTAEELARLRLAAPRLPFHAAMRVAAAAGEGEAEARLARFFALLDDWRTLARRSSLVRLLDRVFRDTRLPDHVAAMPGGPARAARLAALLDRAREFDRFARQGVFRFLRFVERLRERDEDLQAPPGRGEVRAVRVQTIHQSKGLEYPIVAVVNLGGRFHRETEEILVDRGLGVGPKSVDPELGVRAPSLPWLAVRERMRREDLAEEARVLYVALTRARDRLILMGSASRLPDRRLAWRGDAPPPGKPLSREAFFGAESFLDWLMPVVEGHGPEEAGWRVAFHGIGDLAGAGLGAPGESGLERRRGTGLETRGAAGGEERGGERAGAEGAPADGARDDGSLASRWDELGRRLGWTYPFADLAALPAKRAAREWRWPRDPATDEAPEPGELRMREEAWGRPSPGAPRVGAGRSGARPPEPGSPRPDAVAPAAPPTGAEVGNAVHLVFEHIDLRGGVPDAARVRATLDDLSARGLVRPEAARAVDAEMVAGFFRTPLGERVLANPDGVRREWMFTLGLPVAEAHPGVAGEQGDVVVIQGVVDLLLEEEDGFVLVDFKTDRVPEGGIAELVARHEEQVRTYARAVREIEGRDVREAYLYFVGTGDAVRVER